MLIPFAKAKLREFVRSESGATAIEYGIIAGLISIAIIAGATLIGPELERIFNDIATALTPEAG